MYKEHGPSEGQLQSTEQTLTLDISDDDAHRYGSVEAAIRHALNLRATTRNHAFHYDNDRPAPIAYIVTNFTSWKRYDDLSDGQGDMPCPGVRVVVQVQEIQG